MLLLRLRHLPLFLDSFMGEDKRVQSNIHTIINQVHRNINLTVTTCFVSSILNSCHLNFTFEQATLTAIGTAYAHYGFKTVQQSQTSIEQEDKMESSSTSTQS